MGRRRVEPEPEPGPVPEILGPPDELEQAIAGLPQDSSTITLYRIPDQGKPRYVTKLTPEEFDLEQIKRQFGGGRFRYVALQDGIKVQEGHFEIEGEPVLAGRKEEPSPASREVAALTDRLDRLIEALAAKPAGTDVQEKLLTALIARLGTAEGSEQKFLERLAALRAAGLLGGGGTREQGSTLLEAVKLVKEGMMLGGGGEGGAPNPFIYAIEKLTPSIEKTVDVLTSGRPKPPEKPVDKPVLNVSEAFRPFAPLLRPYLPALVASASVDAAPENWAEIIQAHVPAKDRDAMTAWLQGETWFRDLCGLDGRISFQAAWWQELRAILLGEKPPEEEEPEPEAA